MIIRNRLSPNRRYEVVSQLVLALASASFVAIQTSKGFSLPEEAGMFDFSYLLKTFQSSFHSPEQVSFSQQVTLLPWSLLSHLLYASGFSVSQHFVFLYVLRVCVILLMLFRLLRTTSGHIVSILVTLACFTVTPIRVAALYTHWWSHVVLLIGIILVITRSYRVSKIRELLQSVGLVAATVSVWTNPPHLIAAWVALPVAVFLVWNRNIEKSQLLIRSAFLVSAALIVYVVPAILFWKGNTELRLLSGVNVETFTNYGVWQTLQGFAGWWYFDQICLRSGCEPLEPLHFLFMSPLLQVLRASVLVVCVYIALRRKFTPAKLLSSPGEIRPPRFNYGYVLPATLALSLMGSFDIYFLIREKLPLMLQIFREPYPKFSPLFYILLYMWIGETINQSALKHFTIAKTYLVLATIVLIAPLYFPPTESQLKLRSEEWNQIDEAGELFTKLPPRSCVLEMEVNRNVSAFFQVRHPTQHASLHHLRVTWVNDAYRALARDPDAPDSCLVASLKPIAVVIGPNTAPLDQTFQHIHTPPNKSVNDRAFCRSSQNDFLMVMERHCLLAIQVTTKSSQSNDLFINAIGSSLLLSKFSDYQPSTVDSIYIENFDVTLTDLRVELSCELGTSHKQVVTYELGHSGNILLVNELDTFRSCGDIGIMVRRAS